MKNKTVIICCSSLKDYVEHAQNKLNTSYPVTYLNRLYHRDPAEMREHINGKLAGLDQDVETILVCMGFCGGSWEGVRVPCRLVMPKIDECVSLLLQLGDEPVRDLKSPGHLYVREKDPSKESFRRIFDRLTVDIDEETKARYHEDWKRLYHEIDIMDTGLNGCRRPEYISVVKADADWLGADLGFVPAGTHLIEKLLSGKWDEQFMVFEAGSVVRDPDL